MEPTRQLLSMSAEPWVWFIFSGGFPSMLEGCEAFLQRTGFLLVQLETLVPLATSQMKMS